MSRKVITFDLGQSICLDTSDWIQRQIYDHGIYYDESLETELFIQLLRPGRTIVDIGAHIGYYTLLAAARVGPTGQVHAFEPITSNFDQLYKNITLNQFSNVTVERTAISDAPGKLKLYVAKQRLASSLIGSSDTSRSYQTWLRECPGGPFHNFNSGVASIVPLPYVHSSCLEVKATSIDCYAEQSKLDIIDLIKIDVEGAEMKVLLGMRDLLKRSAPPNLLLELHPDKLKVLGTPVNAVLEWLAERGYLVYHITSKGLMQVECWNDDTLLKVNFFCSPRPTSLLYQHST